MANDQSVSEHVHKSVDYLKEFRIKREQEGALHRRKNEDYVDKYLKDPTLNEYQKLDMIKRKAE